MDVNGTSLYLHHWLPEEAPKGIVFIVHGMGEHGGRYAELARQLNASGYAAYAPDLRGHGRTAGTKERFGHFADHHGWDLVIDDLKVIIQQLHHDYPHVPVILLGHSMGSLLARRFIQVHGDLVSRVILSGTSGDPGLLGKIGLLLARWEISRSGVSANSPFLTKLLFGGFNKAFRPNRTAYDWITRDPQEVDDYLNDEWVGILFSAGFSVTLIKPSSHIQQNRTDLNPCLDYMVRMRQKP